MNYLSQDVLFITITLLNVLLTSGNRQIDLCKPRLVGVHHSSRCQRMESVIRRGVRFGYCSTNQAPLAELVALADETLFKNILHIKQHVRHQLLPDTMQSTYNLRSRKQS